MVATNRTAGLTQQFRAQTTSNAASNGTTANNNTKANDSRDNIIANNFLTAPNYGLQNTTIPGQSETARKIAAVSQKANQMTQLGRIIGKFIEDGIKGLGNLFEKATSNKKPQLAKNDPPPPPPPENTDTAQS